MFHYLVSTVARKGQNLTLAQTRLAIRNSQRPGKLIALRCQASVKMISESKWKQHRTASVPQRCRAWSLLAWTDFRLEHYHHILSVFIQYIVRSSVKTLCALPLPQWLNGTTMLLWADSCLETLTCWCITSSIQDPVMFWKKKIRNNVK